MLTPRIKFEIAARNGYSIKQLLCTFTHLNHTRIVSKLSELGYQRQYITAEEWKHLLQRRGVDPVCSNSSPNHSNQTST